MKKHSFQNFLQVLCGNIIPNEGEDAKDFLKSGGSQNTAQFYLWWKMQIRAGRVQKSETWLNEWMLSRIPLNLMLEAGLFSSPDVTL